MNTQLVDISREDEFREQLRLAKGRLIKFHKVGALPSMIKIAEEECQKYEELLKLLDRSEHS